MEVKKVIDKQKIWNKEKAKKLISLKFCKWIYIFRKKASERILIKKMQDYVIELKKEFML